jgi:hypothetical protein
MRGIDMQRDWPFSCVALQIEFYKNPRDTLRGGKVVKEAELHP